MRRKIGLLLISVILLPGVASYTSYGADTEPSQVLDQEQNDSPDLTENQLDDSSSSQTESTRTFIASLESSGGSSVASEVGRMDVVHNYSIINAVAFEGTKSEAELVESLSQVSSVTPDLPVTRPVIPGDVNTENSRKSYDADGSVAVLDTGVDDGHVDLDDSVVENVDVRDGKNNPQDRNGHGTHVASIISGSGEGSDQYAGVAPSAKIRNYKVLGEDGSGRMSDVIEGIDAASDKSEVIVLSLGVKVDDCDGTDPLSRAADNSVNSGTAVVVAAGNSGPDERTLLSPGCGKDVLTVGASHQSSVPDYSSRGLTDDGRQKPDVVAPGTDIMAAEAGTKEQYISKTGTSMAAPYAAGGVLALMSDGYNVSQSFQRIETTAYSIGEPDTSQGSGRINISAAQNQETSNRNTENQQRQEEEGGSMSSRKPERRQQDREQTENESGEENPSQGGQERTLEDSPSLNTSKDIKRSVENIGDASTRYLENLVSQVISYFLSMV